jgi:hypothetical protein
MYFTHMPSDPVLYVDAWQRANDFLRRKLAGPTLRLSTPRRPKVDVAKVPQRRRATRHAGAKLAGTNSPAANNGEVRHLPCCSIKRQQKVQHGRRASQAIQQRVKCPRRSHRTRRQLSRTANETATLESGINASCSFQARPLRKPNTVHVEAAASRRQPTTKSYCSAARWLQTYAALQVKLLLP